MSTYQNCRLSALKFARLLPNKMFVVSSKRYGNIEEFLRTLKYSTADQISVRFEKPKKPLTSDQLGLLYKEIAKIRHIYHLDVMELVVYGLEFPLHLFPQLRSVSLGYIPRSAPNISPLVLPPNLTKLKAVTVFQGLSKEAMPQLLDLEIGYLVDDFNFKHCVNLTRLHMSYDRSNASLSACTALKHLHLGHQQWDTAKTRFPLPSSRLEVLDIPHDNISVDLREISQNPNLTSLTISMANVQEWEDLSVWRNLTRLRQLSVRVMSSSVSTALLDVIKELPYLETLSLLGFFPVNDTPANILLHGTRLTKLVARGFPYMDLSRCTALRDLNYPGGSFEIRSDNLTSLQITEWKNHTILGNISSIRILQVYRISDLTKIPPNLEYLHLGLELPRDDTSIDCLGMLTRLTHLVIREDENSDLRCLRSLTNLVHLHIRSLVRGRRTIQTHVKHVTSLQKLQELSLPRRILSEELDSITNNLTQLTSLRVLGKSCDGTIFTRLTTLVELYFNSPNILRGLSGVLKQRLPNLETFAMDPPYGYKHDLLFYLLK